MTYRSLPFRFFVFPWSARKMRLSLMPIIDRDGAFWVFVWLGFEFGRFGKGEGRGT